MQKKNTIEHRGAALLDDSEENVRGSRWNRAEPPRPRREMAEDFAAHEEGAFRRSGGRNTRIRRGLIGRVPQTRWGKLAIGVGVLLLAGGAVAGVYLGIQYLSRDPRFTVASSQSIELEGNTHVSRAQMLNVFGEDVERNIFHISLGQRRNEMEQIPWVEHATVMRLLPNRIRVHVTERTPVAFVRQGSSIGLVDASGVVLDIPPDVPGNPSYSFPVITGINSNDPLSTRAARMSVYLRFMHDLDSGGTKISSNISEADISDPEDVRALVPDHNSEVLVHFGDSNFLDRYQRMKEHIDEWRSQYPHLASVDMRYNGQAVLQMPQGATSAASSTPAAVPSLAASASTPAAVTPKAVESSHEKKPVKAALSKPAPPSRQAVKSGAGTKAQVASGKVAPADDHKVEAIHAWLAKQEKLHQQKHPSTKNSSASSAVQYHPSQVN